MKAFIFGIGLLLSVPMFGQGWIAEYDGPMTDGDDKGYAIAADKSGNVYVTGESWGTSNSYDYATVKYNSSGSLVWTKRYEGSGNDDIASAIAVDEKYVYVTGTTADTSFYTDCATIKYDLSGNLVWEKIYNGAANSNDGASVITIDNNGNSYVAGYVTNLGYYLDCLTIKYDSLGNEEWANKYATPIVDSTIYDCASAITVDNLGNVYVVGKSGDPYNNSWDYLIIRYNSSGDSMWTRKYDGPANDWDEAKGIVADNNGNIYVTGFSIGMGTGYDYATVKYDSSGDSVWTRRYNNPANTSDLANTIALDNSGNIYVAGGSAGAGIECDYLTIKYNPSGDTLWTRRYNGTGSDYGEIKSLTIDKNDNVYVTGYSSGAGADYVTIKYDSSGNEKWVERYNGQGGLNDYAYAITADSNYVYVTGESMVSSSNCNYVTIKYSCTAVEEENSKSSINSVKLFQNFPNPFAKSTVISYQLASDSKVSLKIYDITGKMVRELVNSEIKAGKYNVNFNAKELVSGIYFIRLVAGNYKDTKRLILLK